MPMVKRDAVALKRPSSRSLVGAVVFVLLVVQPLSRVVDLGSGETALAIADWSYRLLMIGGAAAVTLRALRTLGVDFVQGYHLGRPAPITVDSGWSSPVVVGGNGTPPLPPAGTVASRS